MKSSIHKTCSGARGIKMFKCLRCDTVDSHNYSNGVNVCNYCCNKDNICCICGKPLEAKKSKRTFVVEIECEEFEHNIKNKTEALQQMSIEIILNKLMTGYVDSNSIKPEYHIEVKEV